MGEALIVTTFTPQIKFHNMIRKSLKILLIAMLGTASICAAKSKMLPDSVSVAAQLQQVNARYSQAFVKGDSSLFINCYTPDACLLPANSPAICGRAGQLAFYRFAYRSGIRKIDFHTIALFGLSGNTVTEQGYYEMSAEDGTNLGKGKYLVVWKKTTAGWQMLRDMFNSDAPQPAKKN